MKIVIVTGASSGLGREFVRQIESLYKELDESGSLPEEKTDFWK